MDTVSMFRRSLLCLALVCAALPAAFAGAEHSRIAGTDIEMARPEGFRSSTRFNGFEHSSYLATIMVVEIPGPSSEIQGGMTEEGLASRGMTLLTSEPRAWNGERALLLHVRQEVDGAHFRKWILVSGSEQSTTMIVGSYPVQKAELSEPIQTAMLAATRS